MYIVVVQKDGTKLLGNYSKCSKILNTFLFLFLEFWCSGLELKKCLFEYQTGKTLGLCYLSRPLLLASSVRNFRIFTVLTT